MNPEQASKLAKAKAKYKEEAPIRVGFFGDDDIKAIHESIASIQEVVAANQDKFAQDSLDQIKQMAQVVTDLDDRLKQGVSVKDFNSLLEGIKALKLVAPDVHVPQPIANVENKIVVQDWRKEYMFSDSDKTKSTTYVGFVNPTGHWYIERVTKSETSDKARFIFGKGEYVSNWGKRLQLNYKYLYEAFDAR